MLKWRKEKEKSFWKDREVNREHSVHVAKIMFYMKRKNAHKHTDTHLDVCKTDGFIFKHSGKKKVWLSYVNYFWKKKKCKVWAEIIEMISQKYNHKECAWNELTCSSMHTNINQWKNYFLK